MNLGQSDLRLGAISRHSGAAHTIFTNRSLSLEEEELGALIGCYEQRCVEMVACSGRAVELSPGALATQADRAALTELKAVQVTHQLTVLTVF